MEKKLRKTFHVIVCLMMVFAMSSNLMMAAGNEQAQELALIENTVLLKNNNTQFSNSEDLKFGDTFKIQYYFSDLSVMEGDDTFQIEVNKEYDLGKLPTFLTKSALADATWDVPLEGTNIVLGQATCSSEGNITIKFSDSDDINDADKIMQSYVELSVELDRIQCGTQEKIKVIVGAQKDEYDITILDNKPLPPELSKSVVYDSVAKHFVWTIDIKKSGISYLDGLELVDTFSANQDYVLNSFSISQDGVMLPGVIPVVSGQELSYKSLDGASNYTIMYRTALNNSAYVVDKKVVNDQSVLVSNKAKLNDLTSGNTLSEDATETKQNTGVQWISKTSDEKVIANNEAIVTWRIEVDTNAFVFSDIRVIDTITDGIPSNEGSTLSLVNDSIAVNGTALTWDDIQADNETGTIDTPKYTWSFTLNEVLNEELLNGKYTISYQTKITNYSDYIKYNQPQIKNEAHITFSCPTFDGVGNPPVTYGTPTVKKASSITHGTLKKEYVSYEKSTHQIKWKVTFNSNKNKVEEDVVITDKIADNNEHKIIGIDNMRVDGIPIQAPDNYYLVLTQSDKEYVMEFIDSTLISEKEITFDVISELTNPDYYEGNNKSEVFVNSAAISLNGESYAQVKAQAKPEITVLSKVGTAYDYNRKAIGWKIDINQDKMKLGGAKIEDTLDSNLTLIESSILLKDGQGNTVPILNEVSLTNPYYIYTNNVLSVHLHTINDTFSLEYQSKVDVEEGVFSGKKFASFNGKIPIKNTATLVKDSSAPTKVETTFEVSNKALEKQGVPLKEDQMIKYTVGINQAMVPMKETLFEDVLSLGLQLSVPSIALYEADVNSDGVLTKSNKIEADYKTTILDVQNDKQKPAGSTLFQINIPKNEGKAYVLEYNAYITDFTLTSFNNEITGEGIIPGDTQTSADFSANNVGVGGSGTLIKSSVAEITLEDKEFGDGIEGAQYTLYYQGKEIGKQVSDASGKIVFKGLEEGAEYTLVQTSFGRGYVSNTPVEVVFNGPKKGNANKLEITLNNARTPLLIKNIDEKDNVVVNSTLRIYKLSDDPNEDIKDEDITNLLSEDNLIGEMKTNTTGESVYPSVLPDGMYVVHQSEVDPKYQLSTDYVLVQIENGLVLTMYNSKDDNKVFSATIVNFESKVPKPDAPSEKDPSTNENGSVTSKQGKSVAANDTSQLVVWLLMLNTSALVLFGTNKRRRIKK